MATQPRRFITPEEYLEIERKAEFRSEYFQGEMFPMEEVYSMAGARRPHNLVNTNTVREFGNQLRNTSCEVYSKDMRVHIPATGMYVYPDIVIVCEAPQFLDNEMDTLLNPVLLGEVLSPTTEAYDRGLKFEQSQSVSSLREYLLLSTDHMHADLFTRGPDGKWILSSANSAEHTLVFSSVPCQIALKVLYEKVELPAHPRLRGPAV